MMGSSSALLFAHATTHQQQALRTIRDTASSLLCGPFNFNLTLDTDTKTKRTRRMPPLPSALFLYKGTSQKPTQHEREREKEEIFDYLKCAV